MQIGVYGSGYLATVISACLADFGTPVCCCHADGTRIMEIAKGNIPFFEKNLQEVIRRNVRAGAWCIRPTRKNWRARRR
jgi:UDPglucose 6-dehydrogenase